MRTLYSAQRDGSLIKWNIETLKKIKQFEYGHSDWISQILFDKKETKIYSSGGDCKVIEWDPERGAIIQRFTSDNIGKLYSIHLSTCNRYLYAGDAIGLIIVWNI
jgi:WD40 repeat protein